MKKFKRIMALVIALAMVLGMMSITAFAADTVITFDANTGSGTMSAQTLTDGQGNLAANTFTKADYAFSGWNTAADGSGTAYFDQQTVNLTSATTLYAQWTQYKVTVTNSNESVSIAGKTFKALKLFDATYSGTTTSGVDASPHAYYLSTTSPFYADVYKDIIDDYFDLTTLAGDTTKVMVTPKDEFDEAAAYELAQKLDEAAALSGVDASGYVFSGTVATGSETVDIITSAGGPGYYLVTGEGKSDDGTDPVKAAVALTTTDPAATIKAKLTGNTIDKNIDEGSTKGEKDSADVKEDTHSVGDIVPYVVTTAVPDMTGYEKYYFIVRDTMSKGLTFNDDIKVVITTNKQYVEHLTSTETIASGNATYEVANNGTYYKLLSNGSYTTAKPTVAADKTPDDYADQYEVRNHEFVKYTDVTTLGFVKVSDDKYVKTTTVKAADTNADYDVEVPAAGNGGETFALYFKEFFNRLNGLTGADITITYSATINDDAVISDGDTLNANKNAADLQFSNNPNVNPKPDSSNPDKPDDDTVTGRTPDSETKTFVTGIKVIKTNSKNEKLAGAKFKLTGDAVNKLVETTKEVFVEDASGTYYLLKDGTYTETAPTDQTTSQYVDTSKKYKKTTLTSYAYAPEYEAAADGLYVHKTTDNSYELYVEGTSYATGYEMDGANVKRYKIKKVEYTVETDANGVLTFTGLNAGTYTLTELDAPDGYNILKDAITFEVAAAYDNDKKFTGFSVTKKVTGQTDETLTGNAAELFETTVINEAGVELPSTGGIGTTIFYVVGAILVIGAGVVLITRRRMDA